MLRMLQQNSKKKTNWQRTRDKSPTTNWKIGEKAN